MDFDLPQDLADYLVELDEFIEREITPLEQDGDNVRFFDHRREDARTDWDRGGLPNREWEALLAEARRRADAAGHYRYPFPVEYGGQGGTNPGMAVIREHLAHKGLGLHCDLQSEHAIVGNNVGLLLMLHYGTDGQKAEWIDDLAAGERGFAFAIAEPNHGSDATHMETSAVRRGDHWIINGEKTWNTGIHAAQHDLVFARTSGQPLSTNQAIQFPLVELQTQCEMLRTLVHKTAWMMGTYGAFSQSERVSMCHCWSNRLCCQAADQAMQVHGGMGYSRHQPFEHIYRHHRRYRITEGSEEIQMRRVAGTCSASCTNRPRKASTALEDGPTLLLSPTTVPLMTRHVRLRELLIGIEGLALLRRLYDGGDDEADRRLAEVRELLSDESFAAGELTREADPRLGYSAWSERYDEPGNPIVGLEEPVVWSILEALPPGRALDAACGTGRHAGRLVALGHQVVGVDLTRAMLSHAADSVTGAAFMEADLRAIPAADGRFDVVVCGLALAHVGELDTAVAELGRVLRTGGRLVVSVLHPFQAHLGWHAPFQDEDGQRRFVREHDHSHADYLAAFRSAGFSVRDCIEPGLTASAVQAKRRAFGSIPDATMGAYLGLPGVLIWDAEKM